MPSPQDKLELCVVCKASRLWHSTHLSNHAFKELDTGPATEEGTYFTANSEPIHSTTSTGVLPDAPEKDDVNHPSHYNQGAIEVYDFIADQELEYAPGQVIKYVSRAGKKNPEKHLEDLKKARWYLDREIEKVGGEPVNGNPGLVFPRVERRKQMTYEERMNDLFPDAAKLDEAARHYGHSNINCGEPECPRPRDIPDEGPHSHNGVTCYLKDCPYAFHDRVKRP